jgi:hypothetical protein
LSPTRSDFLESENLRLTSRLATAESRVSALNERCSELSQRFDESQADNDRLKSQLETAAGRYKAQTARLRNKVKECQGDIVRLEDEKAEIEGRFASAVLEIGESAGGEPPASAAVLQELSEQLDASLDENRQLKEMLRTLQEQFDRGATARWNALKGERVREEVSFPTGSSTRFGPNIDAKTETEREPSDGSAEEDSAPPRVLGESLIDESVSIDDGDEIDGAQWRDLPPELVPAGPDRAKRTYQRFVQEEPGDRLETLGIHAKVKEQIAQRMAEEEEEEVEEEPQ